MPPDTFNILMYSHDTYGLGHIRRTMAIAQQLRGNGVNILILTGSPIVGRFDFPEGIDFVRVPGMIKRDNDYYVPHSIRIDPEKAMQIRQDIITSTAKALEPNLFIVDKAPMGLRREVLPTLKWIKRSGLPCCTVLGLRDIMDDAESTIEDWNNKRIYNVLDRYYDEIWVYGHQEMYDPVTQYRIPAHIERKMVFTGYIPRTLKVNGARPFNPKNKKKTADRPNVLVTTGGGGDGYPLMDTFLTMLEEQGGTDYNTILVTGPFMPKDQRTLLAERAKKVGVKFYHFYRRMELLINAADLVVSMGGYNTICEILTHKKVSLIVPRETPRLEQRIRAEVFKHSGLVDFIPWSELAPGPLADKVETLLAEPDAIQKAVDDFGLNGLETIRSRLNCHRGL